MTILAMTPAYLVEIESGLLTIARYTDGHCIAFKGRRIAGEFRDCLKKYTDEVVIDCYIRMAGPKAEWKPLYKPERMKRV